MQKIQKMLLDMLQEIDEICKENDIQYFIDGGTCLGAVRHEGFIPWDNDADIVMTEKNYNRFVAVVNASTEKTHRAVQDNRINREYGTSFGRYVNMDTTKITKNTPFWDDTNAYAGLIIDIFILFPLPKKEPERSKYMNLLAVYDEYQNNTFRHTGRRTEEFIRDYKAAELRSKSVGQVKVLEEMEAKLFNQNLEDFDEYVYCSSPRMFLRTFPRWMFDCEPARIPFEGVHLPVSKYYIEEMRQFYGEDYYIIPNGNHQKVHVDLHSADIPYPYFVRDYMQFLDPADVKQKRKDYKDASVVEGFKRKIWDEDMIDFVSGRVELNVANRIKRDNLDLQKELDNENWGLLNDVFEEYYRFQFSPAYNYWYRFINLEDEVLYVALMNLINQKGDYGKVSRFIGRYSEKVSRGLTPSLNRIQTLFDDIFEVSKARIYGRRDEELKALEYVEGKYPNNREVKIERLKYDVLSGDKRDAEELMKKADKLLADYPGNDEIVKLRGDILMMAGSNKEAMEIYDALYEKTNNGFIKLDIEKRRKAEAAC